MSFNYQIHCNSKKTIYIDRDNIHDAYYNDVRKYPLLTEDEQKELIEKYKFGKTYEEREKAKEKLITSNLRFVVSVAKKLGTSDTFLDLINEGNIGLIKAIEKFDPNKKYKLITYAVSWIVAYIKNYQLTQLKSVVPPNTLKLHNYVKNVSREFFITNEREPTPHEIADLVRKKFNFTISNLEDVELGKIISIDEKYGVDSDSDTFADTSHYNARTCTTNTINNDIEMEYKKHQLNFFLGKLSEREKYIVERVYGIDCEAETFETVGLSLNLCGERVRQICVGAVKKMQDFKKRIDYGK